MADKDNQNATSETSTHSVTSSPPRGGRSYTLQAPQWQLPRLHLGNLAGRSKVLALIVVLVIGLIGGFAGSWLESNHNGGGILTSSTSDQKKVVTSESELVSTIAKNVGPSVVSVNVTSEQSTENFFGFSQPREEEAAGTGIIISSSGLILTNRHVVPDGTTSVSVTLSDGTELSNVKVIGRTNDSDSLDVAFLKVTNAKGHKLTPAIIGDSSKVAVGDEVVAIGNALGQFQNTVTSGIISGYGRSIQAGSDDGSGQASASNSENLDDLFQTDAAINEGNSGGPLVNLNGQVIGINTAIASGSQNIGFAIPINDVKGLIDQIVKTGKFERPYLGVRYIPLTNDIAKQYHLSVDHGAYIAPSVDASQPSVVAGSPAESAGLKEGDTITQLDGTDIDQTHSLTSLLDQHNVGDRVNLTVVNNGKTRHLSVALAAAPSS